MSIMTPLLLFLSGLIYISLDTIRVLIVGRGYGAAAAVVGCVEVVVFLLAVSHVLTGKLEMIEVVSYALGFGAGTWVGSYIEDKMAVGLVLARVITQVNPTPLLDSMAERGFGVTTVAAKGQQGNTSIIFSVIRRRNLKKFVAIIDQHCPNAFVAIEDVRSVREAKQESIRAMVT